MTGAKKPPINLVLILALAFWISNCGKKGTEPVDPNSDIPADPANVTVPAPSVNNLKPTATFETTAGNDSRIRINLLGLLDPTKNYQRIEFQPNQNLFITEDGVVAVLFAEQELSWRAGAQRVYVNFTDEPTQPSNAVEWSTETLCQTLTGKATVHTVWSGSDTASFVESGLVREKPWRMRTCSGGTIKVVPPSAAGLNLADLPVTGALASSSLLEFVSANPNASHTVVITVKASDKADGKTV